jgi:hypothetical protein
MPVHEVMTTPAATVPHTASIRQAIRHLYEQTCVEVLPGRTNLVRS